MLQAFQIGRAQKESLLDVLCLNSKSGYTCVCMKRNREREREREEGGTGGRERVTVAGNLGASRCRARCVSPILVDGCVRKCVTVCVCVCVYVSETARKRG
jgi:hypothetical protein